MKTTKRILSAVLALVICVSVMPFAFAASVRGDANFDGETNSIDALLILKYTVGQEVENYDDYLFDVNGDYTVNSTDALRVLMMSVGNDDPCTYMYKEIAKYYSDALWTSYFETTEVDYSVSMNGSLTRLVGEGIDQEGTIESYPFGSNYSDKAYFENGYDAEGYTPYDYFIDPWIYSDGLSETQITENETGYEVMVQIKEERTTSEDPFAEYITPHTGFYFDFIFDENGEVWGENGMLTSWASITAQVNHDGYVEKLVCKVYFNGEMYLASTQTDERVFVLIEDGEYVLELNFKY